MNETQVILQVKSTDDIISYAAEMNKTIIDILLKIESKRDELKNITGDLTIDKDILNQVKSSLNMSAAVLVNLSDFLFEVSSCSDASDIELLETPKEDITTL